MFFSQEQENFHSNKPLSEINIVPLVDVMLVLLVLFIITAPLLTPPIIKVEVPKVTSKVSSPPSKNIVLAIDKDGKLFWNKDRIDDKELVIRLATAARQLSLPELHLRADKRTPYQRLAEIMAAAQTAGITRLGFILETR
jgi:biopolymer transport protein ExbD